MRTVWTQVVRMIPGDEGGDCPECGDPRTLIGYGQKVFGTVCENCDRFDLIHGDVYGGDNLRKVRDRAARIMELWTDDPESHVVEIELQHIHAAAGGDKEDLYPDE